MKVLPGSQYPLGALFDGRGANFALFSEAAEGVTLCLFDDLGQETCVELPEQTDYVWHGYLEGLQPGQRYGYRVHGPWAPAEGKRSNDAKVLLDPYARAIEGQYQWNEAVFAYRFGDPDGPPNTADDAQFVPKSILASPYYDWRDDRHPNITLHETVIYEAHVKGLTMLHPDVPEQLRGTYAGLAHEAMVEYLQKLGVTAVELMPIHHFVHDAILIDKGLRNYWGYNSIGYFAPHNEYAAAGSRGQQVQEFKHMVQTLHRAGIEVLLDVVYNHTAEGNHLGPQLCFKGIDNTAYYRLMPDDKRYYMDYTGTGNTLNLRHPRVLQLVMDSLRYWVLEMHVDGFRFDLASTLARGLHDVDRLSSFFDLIQQDPVINQVKLIAEPWDVGDGGYQVGNFPPLWSEWNGKYRDAVRDFWRGEDATAGEFANRLAGSSDLYEGTGRRPHASINFVTAHDGFTLADLVSYNEKHNEANLDGNQDGESHNRSWNCGTEGPTEDPVVLSLRARQKRNLLTTLLLSQGVPMVLAGDEMGRTTKGNNNTYCQDNELTWLHWDRPDTTLRDFVMEVIQLRKEHPTFRRWKWFQGPIWNNSTMDLRWLRPDGEPLSQHDWETTYVKAFAMFLNGKEIAGLDRLGNRVIDENFILLFNASDGPIGFTIPHQPAVTGWCRMIDTIEPQVEVGVRVYAQGEQVILQAHSMQVLRGVEQE